jgi:hypothetical protein
MEPPRTGGNTSATRRGGFAGHAAAMEPAVERREQTGTGVGEPQGFIPQRSPPLNGGNTPQLIIREGVKFAVAVMESALIGGSNGARHLTADHTV